jgi:hypothetical protein
VARVRHRALALSLAALLVLEAIVALGAIPWAA